MFKCAEAVYYPCGIAASRWLPLVYAQTPKALLKPLHQCQAGGYTSEASVISSHIRVKITFSQNSTFHCFPH